MEFSVLESSEYGFCFFLGVLSFDVQEPPVSVLRRASVSEACFLTLCARFRACCRNPSSILERKVEQTLNRKSILYLDLSARYLHFQCKTLMNLYILQPFIAS